MNPIFINTCLKIILLFIKRAVSEKRFNFLKKYNLIELLFQILENKKIVIDQL